MRIWIFLGYLLAVFPACGDGNEVGNDTCGHGDNMGNPRVAAGFDPAAAEPELRVLWDRGTGRGAELPDSYFDSVRLSPGTGSSIEDLIQSIGHSDSREITVRFDAAALSAFLETQTELVISLEFPDRTTVLECSHPGMADAYFLDISLAFEAGVLSSSRTNQRKRLGAI